MLIRAILGLWGNFNQWSDHDLVTARTAASAPYVESTLRELQREARQFTLRALKEAGVQAPKSSPPIDLYPRSRVDVLDVYRRPAREAQKVIVSGGSAEEAWQAFQKRLEGIVEADTAIAVRDEIERIQTQLEAEGRTDYPSNEDDPVHDDDNATELFDRTQMEAWVKEWEDSYNDGSKPVETTATGEKVIGWRRVIRPELSMHGTCGLCVVAATQWYAKKDLRAIHHLCKCITLPVTKTADPGLRWNAEDLRRNLDEIYGAAGGSTYGKDLKKLRVSVRDHGELGPILSYSSKKGWTPRTDYVPYTPPNTTMQTERLKKRTSELESTLSNIRQRLDSGVGDREGLTHAIWEVEQSLRELRARIAA